MSDNHHEEMEKTSVGEFLLAVVGGLAAPLLAIALVVGLLMSVQKKQINQDKVDNQAVKVEERIKPLGELTVVDKNAPKVEKSGEEVFQAVCTACHTSGALGAPKIEDKAGWEPRLKQGYDTLLKNALNGIRQMPARGGNPDLSDTEVANALVYMANKSGANFPAPKADAKPAEKAKP